MEIKHTVEILTKDIQEIEKLVRNLNNSPAPSRIDLDLALSKLRNVYELLSMIREDVGAVAIPEEETAGQVVKASSEQVIDQAAEQAPEPALDNVAQQASEEAPKEAVEQVSAPLAEKTIEPVAEEIIREPVPQETVNKTPVQAEIPLEEPAIPKGEPIQHKKKEAEILAEKFSNDPSINENIASVTKAANISSRIKGQPIDNIGRNIGINDRFLIIRELFEGDSDNYTQLIQQLDSSTSETEAIGLLEMKFPGETEHEGYQLLIQLARRKFISG